MKKDVAILSKTVINITNTKLCAFCKYWWDPACKFITPNIGQHWYYESNIKCRCLKKSIDTPAYSTCEKFKLKIEL